nr:uncharacterized protein K02A2.6-like [Rhipicephalus microplus]
MCPSNRRELKTANVVDCSDSDSELDVYHVINTVRSGYEVQLNVEGQDLCMQIDTGAAVTLIPESVRLNAFPHVKCEPSRVALKTYTGEPVPVKGQCNVSVTVGKQSLRLPAIIVKDNGKQLPLLMGRSWLERLGLDWKSVFSINVSDSHKVEAVKKKFPGVFSKQPGKVKNYQARIVLSQNCTAIFGKARNVPFALRDKVEGELERLEKSGVIRPVNRSDWATPVVVIQKKDGSLRLCGDYKAVRFTHSDHIRARHGSQDSSSYPQAQPAPTASVDTTPPTVPMACGPVAGSPLVNPHATDSATSLLPATASPTAGAAATGSPDQPSADDAPPAAELPTLRRSARVRHAPNRYQSSDFRK